MQQHFDDEVEVEHCRLEMIDEVDDDDEVIQTVAAVQIVRLDEQQHYIKGICINDVTDENDEVIELLDDEERDESEQMERLIIVHNYDELEQKMISQERCVGTLDDEVEVEVILQLAFLVDEHWLKIMQQFVELDEDEQGVQHLEIDEIEYLY